MRPVIVVPTYDERDGIGRLLTSLRSVVPEIDVLVVDDDSPDGTGAVVRDAEGFGETVHLLVRHGPRGLGNAYREGFGWALARGYDQVVQMDADLSHPPESIRALLASLDTAHCAIGSRYVPGGSTPGWPLHRRILSRAANAYARTLLGLEVRDVTAGFRAYRATALRAIAVWSTTSDGYGFQVETTWRARRLGLRIDEVPIAFVDRTVGTSKMSFAIAGETLLNIVRWRRSVLPVSVGSERTSAS